MEKIKIKRGNAWGAVPEALIEDPRLGHAAARLGCWLATRPNNWNVDKEYAKQVCQLGESLWDKGCKELRAAGYIVTTQVRESGKFRGLNWSFNPVPDPPDPDATGGGFSAHGEPTHLTRTLKTRTLKQQQQQQPPKQQQRRREVVREVVVVVNNEEDSGQREMQIHWPPHGIEVSDKNKILHLLSRFDAVDAQEIVDEIAGRILISTVRSPVGLARKLAELKQAKQLICELADGVREARESRERNLARIAQANHVVKQVDDKHPKLSEEAERAREKLKELRDSIRRKN